MPDLSAFVPKGMSLRRTISTSGTNTVAFGANFTIYDHAQQSDGKIIIGGNFYAYNNASAGSINRIETNGDLDTAFNTNTGSGPEGNSTSRDVYAVAIQPDGKILVSGLFDGFNGVSQQGLVRLNSDGTADTAFNANVANLFDRSSGDTYAFSIALQSDGKIILGGFWNNGLYDSALTLYNIFYLARLNSDGTIDTTFSSNGTTYPTGAVFKVVVQSDDKILVGGVFTTFNTSGGSVSVSGLARLNANGTLDTTFNTALGTGINTNAVRTLAVQSDGSIIFGGDFTSFNGTTCDIARVSSTGTFDTSFNTNVGTGVVTGAYIFSISVQSDGKILVGGNFLSWNGTTVGEIVRLNSDGTRDTAFTTANGTGAGSSGQIRTLSQLSNGDIFVAGDSLSSWNGGTVDNILTLTSAGAKTTTFLYQPDIVFAILAGGGGRGGSTVSNAGGGGGSGAVVWGLVPASTAVVIGVGASLSIAAGDSYYSTLYANGGVNGLGTSGSNGSSGTGTTITVTGVDSSTTIGGAGSTLYLSVGGAGGGAMRSGVAAAIGLPGSSGTSGGSGGPGISTGANAFSATGGAGGAGLVGGGGGSAGCSSVSSTGSATGGNGGSGIYAGGTASTRTGTGAKYSGGAGGGGLLGAGSNGGTGTSVATGGNGGLGGGGGGGGVNAPTPGSNAGAGGNGALLLYW